VNSYMSLSPTMKMFGGGINHEFSEVEETCILVTFDDIYEAKKARHVDSYLKEKSMRIKERFPLFFENMGEQISLMLANRRERVAARRVQRQARREERKALRAKKHEE